MKRRPSAPTGVQPPERLRRFVADEWQVPQLKEHVTDWELERWSQLGRVHAWRTARRAWTADHGDALGNPLEQMQFERAVRSAVVTNIHEGAK